MKLREAAQQALAALELLDRVMQRSPRTDEAIQALRAALAEPDKSAKSVYLVMSQRRSPVAITYPWPVTAFATRKEAQAYVTEKNKRATINDYVFLRVKFGGGNE